MSNLQVFKNKEFGQVRGKLIDGQPYVVLTDVCKILGLNNVSQVKARLKKDGVITNEVYVEGRFKKEEKINELHT